MININFLGTESTGGYDFMCIPNQMKQSITQICIFHDTTVLCCKLCGKYDTNVCTYCGINKCVLTHDVSGSMQYSKF